MKVKVREQSARELLLALGYENVAGYGEKMLKRRLLSIETDVPEKRLLAIKDPAQYRLMQALISAARKQEAVELVETRPRPRAALGFMEAMEEKHREYESHDKTMGEVLVGANPTNSPINSKTAVKEPPERRQMTAQSDEFPDHAGTIKKPHKHGTIMRFIFEVLRKADERNPVTKGDICGLLRKQFPAKNPVSMESTVNAFPHWLPQHYPFKVRQTDKRYWIEPKLLSAKEDDE